MAIAIETQLEFSQQDYIPVVVHQVPGIHGRSAYLSRKYHKGMQTWLLATATGDQGA